MFGWFPRRWVLREEAQRQLIAKRRGCRGDTHAGGDIPVARGGHANTVMQRVGTGVVGGRDAQVQVPTGRRRVRSCAHATGSVMWQGSRAEMGGVWPGVRARG